MCSNCGSSEVQRSGNQDGYPIGCCSFVEGYYCIWTLDHSVMECEEWAELCDLRSVIHTVSHITFNVVAERGRARTALSNLKRLAPFGECKRFPYRKTYVNLSCSVYSLLLQDILASLDYKDRETEKELRYGSGHKQDDKDQTSSGSSSMDDSKTRFRNTVVKLQNALCKRDEVYDRQRFESKYDLRWCAGSCPKEGDEEGGPGGPDPPSVPRYGDIMDALKKAGMNPNDFNVFGLFDSVKNDFDCDRQTQRLGPSMRNVKILPGALDIFIFASAEYAECGDSGTAVDGFVYHKITKRLEGPIDLKKYGKEFREESGERVLLDRVQWEMITELVSKFSEKEKQELLNYKGKEVDSSGEGSGSSGFERL